MQDPSSLLAALYLDLENFYQSRAPRQSFGEEGRYSFSHDLRTLQRALEDLSGGRRVAVQRAYADFLSGKRIKSVITTPLGQKVSSLYDFGIEPIQVFPAFPGAKNSVDMRLTVDALRLALSDRRYRTFILVSGDSDFVPLIQELKQLGIEVVVLGVDGASSKVVRKLANRFEFFRDLEHKYRDEDLVTAVEIARGLLAEKSELLIEQLQKRLEAKLPQGWSSMDYDCPSFLEFMRQYADSFGGTVRKRGQKYAFGLDPRTAPAVSRPKARAPRPHSVTDYYKRLLEVHPELKIHLVQEEDWNRITATMWSLLESSSGERPEYPMVEFKHEVGARLQSELTSPVDEKVEHVLFQMIHSGCLLLRRDGKTRVRQLRLSDEVKSLKASRERNTRWVVDVLVDRMSEQERANVDPAVVAELLYGPGLSAAYGLAVEQFVADSKSAAREGLHREPNWSGMLLGEILQARGFLEDAHVDQILAAQEGAESRRPFGETAVELKLCTADQIRSCLELQSRQN